MSLSRREFVYSAASLAAAGFGTAAGQEPLAMAHGQEQPAGGAGGPVVVASGNGYHPDRKTSAIVTAMELLMAGADPLDAVIAGVNLVEDDPTDHSVGLGGLPNEDGVVELDSSVMHGPRHKAGAVAALRNIRNPSKVARLVMQRTDHVLIVGEGALRFAKAHGFREEELLTDEAREIWLKWKETHSADDDWIRPEADRESSRRLEELRRQWPKEGPEFTYGTINCCALTAGGDLAGVTTTSGLSYKIPGRVGDSPIIGAGLYVDNEVGAAGSTGRGEANLQNCSSFMIVESMRQGRTPTEACVEVVKRVAAKAEPRLRNEKGEAAFGLTFYAVRKDGLWGGATLRGKVKMAVHDGKEPRHVELVGLYPDA